MYEAIRGAGQVIKQSFKIAHHNPQIFFYPYAALFFVTITYSVASATLFAQWYGRIFSDAGTVAPHRLSITLGLVGFSAFYAAIVSAYFATAVSASVLAKLENRPAPAFYGLRLIWKHFFRITRFALLSIFFFPAGIYAQRGKPAKAIVGVLGSSLTLQMAQVAPAILSTDHKFSATIRDSIDMLGKAWRVGLVLKIGMYLSIFVIVILPKLIQHQWFKSETASNIGWLISLELAASSYVVFKVINSIFTTVLYHHAKTNKNK